MIRDSRDASLDYYILADRAKKLYRDGMIDFDSTNNCYTTQKFDRNRVTIGDRIK